MSLDKRFQWRFYALCVVFLAGAAVLFAKVLLLQLFDVEQGHRFLQNEGDMRSVRVVTQPAPRGIITDRNGTELAISTPVYTIGTNPSKTLADTEGIAKLSEALDQSTAELTQYLMTRSQRQFVYLRRNVPPQFAAMVKSLGVKGVRTEPGFRRFYPAGELVSQIIGYNDVDDAGIEGVERMFDDYLQAEPSKKRVLRDLHGDIVRELDVLHESSGGDTLQLSIDLNVQYMVYTALARSVEASEAKSGAAVFIDRRSGEVLAMANYPSFNPNNRSNLRYEDVRNRAVTDIVEPGSTIKPFTVMAALEIGSVQHDSVIDTSPGWIVVDGKTLKDFRDYGELDLQTVLAKSSQIGVTKIALQTDPFAIRDVFERLGFGQQVGIGLLGEADGILPYHRKWPQIDRAALAFGHGLAISALQLAQAYQILANDGVKVPLTLMADANSVDRSEVVVSESSAKAVKNMLAATFEEGGTAASSKLSVYRLAGKTGTAHKVGGTGYLSDRYRALFAGFAPASNPEIVGVVVIDEPGQDRYYGGEVAAPVFAQVAQQALPYLGVKPHLPDDGDVAAQIQKAMQPFLSVAKEGV